MSGENRRSSEPDTRLSRRELLRRGLWLGAGATSLGILASCGGENAPTPSDGNAANPTAAQTGSGTSTGTPVGGGAPGTSTTRSGGTSGKGQVLVRTNGGVYEDALREHVFAPFTAETGIEVLAVPANIAKILAMIESGNVELDVLDLSEYAILSLQQRDALVKLDLAKFSRTDLDDIDPVYDYYIGENTYATVLGYNTEAFPDGHPTSWAEFWDVAKFPGRRMLEDMAAEYANLEFALLADGVPMDQLYPLDVDRAFKKLGEIRDSIIKWWDTGAISAQMLSDRQVDVGSVWHSRIFPLIAGGAPLAVEWNQSSRHLQGLAILKDAPNLENAYLYIDFALQPEVQAKISEVTPVGPTNRKAFDYLDDEVAEWLPTAPAYADISFPINTQWWVDNRDEVAVRWQEFLLEG